MFENCVFYFGGYLFFRLYTMGLFMGEAGLEALNLEVG